MSVSPPTTANPAAKPRVTAAGQAYVFRGEGSGLLQELSWNTGRVVSRIVGLLLFGLRSEGLAHIPATGPVLLVTNHQSFLDPWLVGIPLSRQVHFMARDTLFKGGILGYLLEIWNSFPVKRGSADLGAIRNAVDRLEAGRLLNLFPEGTRSEDGTIAPLEPGITLVLRRCKVPVTVIPTLIDGAWSAWPKGQKFPHGGHIRLIYGTPLNGDNLKKMKPDALVTLLRETLVQMQEKHASIHASHSRQRLVVEATAAAPPER